MQGIVFAGCSFTYGEGLDLYCNTEKWIEQRNHTTHDAELRVIADSDGTNFRLNNNFGGILTCISEFTPGNKTIYVVFDEESEFSGPRRQKLRPDQVFEEKRTL